MSASACLHFSLCAQANERAEIPWPVSQNSGVLPRWEVWMDACISAFCSPDKSYCVLNSPASWTLRGGDCFVTELKIQQEKLRVFSGNERGSFTLRLCYVGNRSSGISTENANLILVWNKQWSKVSLECVRVLIDFWLTSCGSVPRSLCWRTQAFPLLGDLPSKCPAEELAPQRVSSLSSKTINKWPMGRVWWGFLLVGFFSVLRWAEKSFPLKAREHEREEANTARI